MVVLNRTIQGAAAAFLAMVMKDESDYGTAESPPPVPEECHVFVSKQATSSALRTYEERVFGTVGPRLKSPMAAQPTFQQVYTFVHSLFKRAQIEPECCIASVQYLATFLAATPGLLMTRETWQRLVFTSMMISSKMHDDVSCSSSSFALCAHGDFNLRTLNAMEAFYLERLSFNLYLTADDYRRTYYALKSLWLRYDNEQIRTDDPLRPSAQEIASWNIPERWGVMHLFHRDLEGAPDAAAGLGAIKLEQPRHVRRVAF